MGYESLNILPSYKTNKHDIVRDFYTPVLKESVLYKRAVGFFSSTALIELSKGIAGLIRNGGKIRFIVSPLLSEEDIEAIQRGYDERKIIQDSLMREFKEPTSESDAERLGWLAFLIASGRMELKVAFTPPQKNTGMYHEKIGILYDLNGEKIAFTGSMNETINAFHNNYESIVVFNSLVEEDFKRVIALEQDFDMLWDNRESNITVLEFPYIVKEKLISYKRNEINLTLDQIELENIIEIAPPVIGIPNIPKGVVLHDYQQEAINNWADNAYCGIFDMATGTGKTFTGLGAIARLYHDKRRLAIFIVCPYQHLVEQWVEDILKFNMRPTIGYSASKQKDWKKRLSNDVLDFKLGVIDTFCFVTTNATYASDFVQNQLSKLGKDTLLLVDEAHNFGSNRLRALLNPQIQYKLALSATLERHGDPDGTAALVKYFGPKCIEYGLERAIRENKLTPYYYYPVKIYLAPDEIEQYRDLSYKISKECHQDKNGNYKITEKGKTLLLARSRIVAGARQKLVKLKELMQKYKEDTHILVYCGATKVQDFSEDDYLEDSEGERQIVCVSKILGNELGMKVRHFTSNESAEEREIIKKKFATASPYQAIVAIKCLDEGVNIPSIKTAFILASTTNPKEYIQRRGRVLRLAPNKPYAVIYDFTTFVNPLDDVDPYSADYKFERSLAKREAIRVKEFGNIALNSREAFILLEEIQSTFDITDEELEETYDGNEP